VSAVAAARRAPGLVATMLAAMPGEQERAAGAWQAEAATLDELLGLAGAAVGAIRRCLEGLEVFPARMRENLDLTDGLMMSESLASALGAKLGRAQAQELAGDAARRAAAAGAGAGAAASGASLARSAAESPEIVAALGAAGIEAALDPAAYLGQTEAIIDNALSAHRARTAGARS